MSLNKMSFQKTSFLTVMLGLLAIGFFVFLESKEEIMISKGLKNNSSASVGENKNAINPIKYNLVEVEFNKTLTVDQVDSYRKKGVFSVEHKSDRSYYFYAKKESIKKLKNGQLTTGSENNIVSVEDVSPISKIPAYVQNSDIGEWAISSEGDYKLNIEFLKNISPQDIKSILKNLNLTIFDEQLIARGIVSVIVPPALVNELASIASVVSIDIVAPPLSIDNSDAAIYNNVAPLFASGGIDEPVYNLTGKGVDVLVIDGGKILETHQEFQQDNVSKVTNITAAIQFADHATHVAGSIAAVGVDEKARGMATDAKLYAYSFLDTQWNNTQMENAYDLYGIKLSNNSYGLGSNHQSLLGKYLLQSKEMDDTVYNNPKLLVVKSAGNDRSKTDAQFGKTYGIIKGFGNSKNVITIGAASDTASAVNKTNGMTDFSSWGPVLDGRIKPDLVANGHNVYSTIPRSNDSYDEKSGTSMAGPVAAGISALVVQEYENLTGSQNIRADMLKALLVNTATDLGNDGPDYAYGFGMINAKKAIDSLRYINQNNRLFLNGVKNDEVKTYQLELTSTEEVKISISWLDVGANINNQEDTLVNDIDILLTSDLEEFYPYSLDKDNPSDNAKQNAVNIIDNTEQIRFTLTPGNYVLTVKGSQIVNGEQAYALVSSHDLVALEQPLVTLDIISEQTVKKGDSAIALPITFTNTDDSFTYIDAYSEDEKLIIDVNKDNILSISSDINNTNSHSTVTVKAMAGGASYETNFNVNLLDAQVKFKPTLNAYRSFNVETNTDFKNIVLHDNKLYVSDFIENNIKVFSDTGELLEEFGDGLSSPQGLLFVGDKLYVVDANNNRIQIYNNTIFESSFGLSGQSEGQFNYPNAISIDSNGYLYVSDRYNERVQVFDENHNFIKIITMKLGYREFYDISSLAISNNDELFVVDRYANKIQKFDDQHNHISIIGKYGTSEGGFDLPESIAIDLNNDLYVLDNNGIQIFNPYGDFVKKLDAGLGINKASAITVSDNHMYIFDAKDKSIKSFDMFSLRKKLSSDGSLMLAQSDFVKSELYNSVVVEKIKITALPEYGELRNQGVLLQVNDVIDVNNINVTYNASAQSVDDKFAFSAANESGFTQNSMTVLLAANHSPEVTLGNDELIVDEDGNSSFRVTDIDNNSVSTTVVIGAINGTVTINGDTITYTANAGYSGTDTFTILIDDGDGGLVTKQINVIINEKNDAPVITNLEANQWQPLSTPVSINTNIWFSQITQDHNNVPYIAYVEPAVDTGEPKIVIAKYYNEQWVQVGDTQALIYNIQAQNIIDFNAANEPFIVFSDKAIQGKISVKKYNGLSWDYVGGSTGISAATSNHYSIKIDRSDVPYIIYEDPNQLSRLTIKTFVDGTWENVGEEGFDGSHWSDVESEFSQRIGSTLLIDNNNQLFVVYKDYEHRGRVGVKHFINDRWKNISGEGLSVGIPSDIKATINNDELIILYKDTDLNNRLSAKKYSNGKWISLGADGFSAASVDYASVSVNDEGIPYVAYTESENGDNVIITLFNGERWQAVSSVSDVEIKLASLNVSNRNIILNYFNGSELKVVRSQEGIISAILEGVDDVVTILASDSDDLTLQYELIEGYDSYLFKIDDTGDIRFIESSDYTDPKDFNKNNHYVFYVKVIDKSVFTIARVEVEVTSLDGLPELVSDGTSSGFSLPKTFSITLSDAAGNISDSSRFSVKKDVTPPSKADLVSTPYATSSDQATIEIYGQPGSSVYVNGILQNQVIGSNGSLSLTLNTAVIGENTYTIVTRDTAGNNGEPLVVTIHRFNYDPSKAYAQLGSLQLTNANIRVYEIGENGHLAFLFNETSNYLGEFNVHTDRLQSDRFYLYEIASGNDNQGTVRSVVKGEWLLNRTEPFIVSVASEMVYALIAKELKYNFSESTFVDNINIASSLVLQDLNGDSRVDGVDSTLFDQQNVAHSFNSTYDNIPEIIHLIKNNDLSYISLVFKDQSLTQYINLTDDNVSSMVISKNEQYAYLSTTNGLKILDITNPLVPEQVLYQQEEKLSNISQAYLSHDDKYYIAVNADNKKITIVDVSTPNAIKLSRTVLIYQDDEIVDVKFTEDSKTAIFLYKNHIAKLLIRSTESLALTYQVGLGTLFNAQGAGSFALSNDDVTLYVIGQEDRKILVVDTSKNRVLKSIALAKPVRRISLMADETNILGLNEKSTFLINIEDVTNAVISDQYKESVESVKYAFVSDFGNKLISNTENGYRVLDVNDRYALTKSYSVDIDEVQHLVSNNGYISYVLNETGISVYDYDMFKNSLEQDQRAIIKGDVVQLTVYGQQGDKVFVNGVDTGVVISESGSAIVNLNFDEYVARKNFYISVGSNNNANSFVLVVSKDLELPNKPSVVSIPHTTTKDTESVDIKGTVGTMVYVNGVSTGQIIGNSGSATVTLAVNNLGDNNYTITVKNALGIESEPLSIIINRFIYDLNNAYAQLGSINLVDANVKVYEIISSATYELLYEETTASDGTFNAHLENLESNKYYLYEVSKGNGNAGTVRAIVKGEWLLNKTQPFIVSLASEMVYDLVAKYIKYDFNTATIDSHLNTAAALVVNDVNVDGVIDVKDSIVFNQQQVGHEYNANYNNIDEITSLLKSNDLAYLNSVFANQLDQLYLQSISDSFTSLILSKNERYAYLSTQDGLKIVDVSNPLLPQTLAYKTDARLQNISQAYLSKDGNTYIAVSADKKKITPVDISEFTNIKLGEELTYLSDNSEDEIVSMSFVDDDTKLYVLTQKTVGYYAINNIDSLQLEFRIGGFDQYIETFKGFAVSDAEQVYFIGEDNENVLILDVPNLALAGLFSVTNETKNSINISEDGHRLTVYDEYGLMILNIADNNSLSLVSLKSIGALGSQYSAISMYGDKFFVSAGNELFTFNINSDNVVSESYNVNYAETEDNLVSLSGRMFYTQNNHSMKIYDYSMFEKYTLLEQPRLVSRIPKYTNKESITLNLIGNRNDNIVINGVPMDSTINTFFAEEVVYPLSEEDGLNNLSIQFEQQGQLSEPLYVTVTKDTIKPEITRFSPSDESLLSTENVAITLSYLDNIEIDVKNSAIYLDNEEIDNRAIKQDGFVYLLNLEDKRYKVTAELYDFAGNLTHQEYTFVINTQTPTVRASQEGGEYSYPLFVELLSADTTTIYYSIDGSEPDENSEVYSSAINIDKTTILKYFAKNNVSEKTSGIQTQEYILSLGGPQVLTGYPANGQTFGSNDEFSYTFITPNTITSITVVDEFGTDISHLVSLDGNTVRLDIGANQNRPYNLTVIATDNNGNTTSIPLEFWVDTVSPVTVVNISGGRFNEPLDVALYATEEGAKIYYSTDGYPPVIGAANTFGGQSLIENITISNTANLQFFAVDAAGNTESMKSEVYYIGDVLDHDNILALNYSEEANTVTVSWPDVPQATSYNIYRVDNIIDYQVLQNSFDNAYLAPKKYLLTATTNSTYTDANVNRSLKYYYAVSRLTNGVESIISSPVSIETNNTSSVVTLSDSIERATGYLYKTQQEDGSWSTSTGSHKSLYTSQVLDALSVSSNTSLSRNKALFYLKGHLTDNNDALARKISTLSAYGLNSDSLINKLVAAGEFTVAGTSITNAGWGSYDGFKFSAYETSLAVKALRTIETTERTTAYNQFNVYSPAMINLTTTRQWPSNSYFTPALSVYVSALSYSISNNTSIFTWLTQNANGSYGNGVIDTAGVLLYVNISAEEKAQAINYIISEQEASGRFGDIPTTAISLQALKKAGL